MSFHWASATRPRLSLPDLHSSITAPLSLSRSAVEHLFVQSSICLFTLCFVFIHLFDHSLVCSFIHSFKHLRIHSCTSSFVLFITHSLAHSLTHQPVHAGWIAILQHIPSHCDCHSQNGQSVQQPPLCDILQPVFQVDRARLLSTNECHHKSCQEHTRIALSTKVLCQTLLDCVMLEMQ